ncbi:hypothetical protein [Streptomyces sp. or20]|uniref:hypothetical protein n=1 Tax=Streptomyces sp. or20 TaxID=1828016 RepID=UPI00117E481F|nr:hypothetical protein [Streptomyces sp. or20]
MEELLATLSSVIAALAGCLAYFAAVRTRKVSRELDSRSQAGQVFAHVTRNVEGKPILIVENHSDESVHDVKLELSDFQVSFNSLEPGTRRITVEGSTSEPGTPTMKFKDSQGHEWVVKESGLREANPREERYNSSVTLTASTALALLTGLLTFAAAVTAAAIILMSKR